MGLGASVPAGSARGGALASGGSSGVVHGVVHNSDSNGSTGTNHGSLNGSENGSGGGSGSGSGSERGGGAREELFEKSFSQRGPQPQPQPQPQPPPPYEFGTTAPRGADARAVDAGANDARRSSDFLTDYAYGNGISRENGGGGPAVAAVALLGGGGGALGGLHAVNGLDPESGVALPSRRSFDGAFPSRNREMRRRADRGGPSPSPSPSLLGGMSNLGLRGRRSVDAAVVNSDSRVGWDTTNGMASFGASAESPNKEPPGAPTPSREAMRALLRGGPGDAAVPGSKPSRGDEKSNMGPRNSSFQHLGMIEGVLGDETFLGA